MKTTTWNRILAAALSLLMSGQGLMLLWTHCCCGNSGFKPCACGSEAAASTSGSTRLDINSPDDCSCQTYLIADTQQPVPLAKPLAFNHGPVQTLPSLIEGTPPAPGLSVSHTGLATLYLEPLNSHLTQPFLCVFRC